MRIGLAAAAAVCGVYYAQQATGVEPLPRWIPAGAQVYLEARDFGALLREWNASAEKRQWLESANYSVFAKSRLFLRLGDAQGELAAVSGLGLDRLLLEQLAGGASALAVYDIGKLEFLYVTKLAAAPALQTVAGQFTNRTAAGVNYSVKSDPATGRTVAFAFRNGWLLVSTSENHLARALELMAGQGGGALAGEGWFERVAQAQGELRLAANLASLARSPHFRSYWVQRNLPELAELEGAMADLTRSTGAWVETRTLGRKQPASAAPNAAALRAMARAVPDDAGFYRLGLGAPPARLLAAPAAATFVEGQDAADLETRIDVAPFTVAGASQEAALAALFGNATAHAVVRTTRLQPDQVFISPGLGVAVLGAANWDAAAARALLPGYAVAAAGPLLYIANHEPLLRAMQAGSALAIPGERTVYLASFRHGAERLRLFPMASLIDFAGATPAEQPEQRTPEFFSENMASLSAALRRFSTATVSRQDEGGKLTETVTYTRQP
ncbi:MAG: hypothetical protein ACK5UT_14010 [Acidobacteriota bacterium]